MNFASLWLRGSGTLSKTVNGGQANIYYENGSYRKLLCAVSLIDDVATITGKIQKHIDTKEKIAVLQLLGRVDTASRKVFGTKDFHKSCREVDEQHFQASIYAKGKEKALFKINIPTKEFQGLSDDKIIAKLEKAKKEFVDRFHAARENFKRFSETKQSEGFIITLEKTTEFSDQIEFMIHFPDTTLKRGSVNLMEGSKFLEEEKMRQSYECQVKKMISDYQKAKGDIDVFSLEIQMRQHLGSAVLEPVSQKDWELRGDTLPEYYRLDGFQAGGKKLNLIYRPNGSNNQEVIEHFKRFVESIKQTVSKESFNKYTQVFKEIPKKQAKFHGENNRNFLTITYNGTQTIKICIDDGKGALKSVGDICKELQAELRKNIASAEKKKRRFSNSPSKNSRRYGRNRVSTSK